MRLYCLIILFFISSCGAPVTVNSRGCQNIQLLSQEELNQLSHESSQLFQFEHVVWTGGGIQPRATHSLKEALNEKDIACEDVKAMHYAFLDKWQDVFLGFIPFANRQTLLIEGVYR